MKIRPGLIGQLVTVVLLGTGHIVEIDDVRRAFRYGRDDPEPGLGDGVMYRRQRVGSWEARIFPRFVWAAVARVHPRGEGRERWWRRGVFRGFFFLISRRRWVPDLTGSIAIHRVLCIACRDG